MDGDAVASINDGGILVLAIAGKAFSAALEPAIELSTEVPAAGSLQEVTANGGQRAKLWSGGVAHRLNEDREPRGDLRAALDVGQRRECSHAQRTVCLESQITECAGRLEIDEPDWGAQALLHQR